MADIVWIARHANRQDFVDPDWRSTAERPHDPGLSVDGILQAEQLGEHLKGKGIRHLFASPFLRTVETAHYVAEALRLHIRLEPGLGEWMNPDWFASRPEILPFEELVGRFPRINPEYEPHVELPYPETREEAFARAGRAARVLADTYEGPLLIVGHGASVVGAARGLVDAGNFDTALCSLTKIEQRDGAWEMTLCADVAHLEESKGADRLH